MPNHPSYTLTGIFFVLLAFGLPVRRIQTLPPPGPGSTVPGIPSYLSTIVNSPDYSGCSANQAPVVQAGFEQEVVERVNSLRAENGLPPLKRVSQLDDAARYHAADMEQDNYFDHNSYDRVNNQLQLACEWSKRLAAYYTGWSYIAENIGKGYGSSEEVMNGWMNSPGHRANILNKDITEIGVGYFTGDYWVQDFGRRSGTYPVVINLEAGTTSSRDVDLYIYGNWNTVRIRNGSGLWSDWIPFQNTIHWQLPAQAGAYTVTVEMRNGTESATSSDEIRLELNDRPSLEVFLPFLDSSGK